MELSSSSSVGNTYVFFPGGFTFSIFKKCETGLQLAIFI